MSQKNITRFANQTEYDTAFDTISFPNVSYIDEGDEVRYMEEHPYMITGTSTYTAPFSVTINNIDRTVTLKEGGDWEINVKSYLPLKSLYDFVYNKGQLTTLKFPKNLDTSNVTSMKYMFYNCSTLTSLDVSHFNTSNVTNMEGMFRNCSGLTTLDLSNFNTSNVTNMEGMFRNCSNLTTLRLPQIGDGTKNVWISNMFNSCTKLANIPSCGDIHNTVNFYHCPLTLDSAKVVLNALSTPYSGAQDITFSTSTKNLIKADADAMALVEQKRSIGWTMTS